MKAYKSKKRRESARAYRTRNRIRAAETRPRLSVHRSGRHITAQIIDDLKQQTLAYASSVGKSAGVKDGGNVEGAQAVGRKIAELALAKGIKQVAFDRGKFRYHGRVKALADAAREAGLDF
jgi:large subunit ribosomal protein L18